MNSSSLNSLKEKIQKIKWPVWLPYPSSWIRMLGLALPAYCTGIVPIFSIEVWRFFFVFMIAWFGGHPEPLVELWFVLGSLSASFILYLIAVLIYAKLSYLFLKLFWSKPPKWIEYLRPCKNLREIFWGFCVATLAMSVAFIPFMGLSFSRDLVSESFIEVTRLKARVGENEAIGLYIQMTFGLWFIPAAYLYQFEYLFRKYWVYKRQTSNQKQSKSSRYSQVEQIDPLDLELSRLRGDMGLHQIRRGKTISTIPRSQKPFLKLRKVGKVLFSLLLIPLVAGLIYGLTKLPILKNDIPTPITSTPPVPSLASQFDPFRLAINKAMKASQDTQSAKTQSDWKMIANQWQEAIALMQSVPSDHPQYQVSRQKAIEYQTNLTYAQRRVSQNR